MEDETADGAEAKPRYGWAETSNGLGTFYFTFIQDSRLSFILF